MERIIERYSVSEIAKIVTKLKQSGKTNEEIYEYLISEGR